MVNFPFFRSPYSNYYHYGGSYQNRPPYRPCPSLNGQGFKEHEKENVQANEKKASNYNRFGPVQFQNPFDIDQEEPIFEIFGISLYLDDLIILALLFFLYKEEVKDETLFISLILLLLS